MERSKQHGDLVIRKNSKVIGRYPLNLPTDEMLKRWHTDARMSFLTESQWREGIAFICERESDTP